MVRRIIEAESAKAAAAAKEGEAAEAEALFAEKPRDPRLPEAGTVITREWRGETYEVTVGETDFSYDGETYKSLSGVAKHITGQIQNGYRWFKLGEADTDKARERRATATATKAARRAEALVTRVKAFIDKGDAPADFLDAMATIIADARARAAQ